VVAGNGAREATVVTVWEYFCNETDQLWKSNDSDLVAPCDRANSWKIWLARREDVVDGCGWSDSSRPTPFMTMLMCVM